MQVLKAQLSISGTVYDITKKTPMPYVSVVTTSGNGTVTDSAGYYTIRVKKTDSIYFSYLDKPTPKYAVANILTQTTFDISIQTRIAQLPSIFIKQPNYRFDSYGE